MRLLDSIFVLRPTLMFPLITMILAGHFHADVRHPMSWDRWLMLMVALCAMFGLGYLLNQFKDRVSDKSNGKLFLITEGYVDRRHALILSVLLSLLVLIALLAAGFERLLLYVVLMFVVGGILYNYTPVALQNSPFGGVTAGFAGGFLLLFLGGLIAGEPGSFLWMPPYLIAFGSACTLTCLLDVKGDRISGKNTFAVVYGVKKTMVIALTGFILTIIWGLFNRDWMITLSAVVSTPFLFWGCLNDNVNKAVLANKLAIFILSCVVGIAYPAYLFAIALYLPLARWYYSRRLGIRYPSFSGR